MSVTTLEDRPAVSGDYFELNPLQPKIGAELLGIDLAKPLSDGARDAIKAAILKYRVVFFRDQNLNAEQHELVARRFGPLSYRHQLAAGADLGCGAAGGGPAPGGRRHHLGGRQCGL